MIEHAKFIVKVALWAGYVITVALSGSRIVSLVTTNAMQSFSESAPTPTTVALELTLAEVVAFLTFCSLVLPMIWYVRGLAAKIEQLDERAKQNSNKIEMNFDRLETQIQAHSIDKCPVASAYLAQQVAKRT